MLLQRVFHSSICICITLGPLGQVAGIHNQPGIERLHVCTDAKKASLFSWLVCQRNYIWLHQSLSDTCLEPNICRDVSFDSLRTTCLEEAVDKVTSLKMPFRNWCEKEQAVATHCPLWPNISISIHSFLFICEFYCVSSSCLSLALNEHQWQDKLRLLHHHRECLLLLRLPYVWRSLEVKIWPLPKAPYRSIFYHFLIPWT